MVVSALTATLMTSIFTPSMASHVSLTLQELSSLVQVQAMMQSGTASGKMNHTTSRIDFSNMASVYRYTDSGPWTAPASGDLHILLVGGGGGGGGRSGGGGGGGGILNRSNYAVAAGQTFDITVGSGGAGGAGSGESGWSGGQSCFGELCVPGGGGGGSDYGPELDDKEGQDGGCGGGGKYGRGGGKGSHGGDGGYGTDGSGRWNAGGGGGGGGDGADGTWANCGVGGIGYESCITGVCTRYAGGGGGGSHQPPCVVQAAGGEGGGGAGGYPVGDNPGVNGTDTLGGGGGGGSTDDGPGGAGGNGGRGVVIFKYLTASPTSSPSSSPTASPTSSPTAFIRKTVILEGDYNAVVDPDKGQFLSDCSAVLSPVTCFDARPGSIALTLQGDSSDVAQSIVNMNHNGLSIPGYPTMVPSVTATGDPHMTTVTGQSFDLKLHGNVTLLRMPRGSEGAAAMLHVDAATRQYKAEECSTLYIARIRVSGKWVRDTKTPDRLFVAQGHGQRKRYLRLGPGVVLVISNGVTDTGVTYLNFRARDLQKANMTIGGLLGGESYPWDAQMAKCTERESAALLMTSAEVSVGRQKVRASTAVASLGAIEEPHHLAE